MFLPPNLCARYKVPKFCGKEGYNNKQRALLRHTKRKMIEGDPIQKKDVMQVRVRAPVLVVVVVIVSHGGADGDPPLLHGVGAARTGQPPLPLPAELGALQLQQDGNALPR